MRTRPASRAPTSTSTRRSRRRSTAASRRRTSPSRRSPTTPPRCAPTATTSTSTPRWRASRDAPDRDRRRQVSGGLFGGLNVSASGMTAERLRMDVIAENLANADTTRGPDGKPYRRKEVVLSFDQALDGVKVAGIAEDASPPRKVYDPGHPDADAQGYVSLPNVEPV